MKKTAFLKRLLSVATASVLLASAYSSLFTASAETANSPTNYSIPASIGADGLTVEYVSGVDFDGACRKCTVTQDLENVNFSFDILSQAAGGEEACSKATLSATEGFAVYFKNPSEYEIRLQDVIIQDGRSSGTPYVWIKTTKYFFDTKAMTVTELASDATTWIPAYFEGYIIFKPVLVQNYGLEGNPIESWIDYLNHDYDTPLYNPVFTLWSENRFLFADDVFYLGNMTYLNSVSDYVASKLAVTTPGDANKDGSADVLDLVRVKKYAAGVSGVTVYTPNVSYGANIDITEASVLLNLKKQLLGAEYGTVGLSEELVNSLVETVTPVVPETRLLTEISNGEEDGTTYNWNYRWMPFNSTWANMTTSQKNAITTFSYYVENNTSDNMFAFCLIDGDWAHDLNGTAYTYNINTGEVSTYSISGFNSANVPMGFKGYVVYDLEKCTVDGGSAAEYIASSSKFNLFTGETDGTKNDSYIINNVCVSTESFATVDEYFKSLLPEISLPETRLLTEISNGEESGTTYEYNFRWMPFNSTWANMTTSQKNAITTFSYYVENNTSDNMFAFCLINGDWKHDLNGTAYTYNINTGEVSTYSISGFNSATVPEGFKGYVVYDLEKCTVDGGSAAEYIASGSKFNLFTGETGGTKNDSYIINNVCVSTKSVETVIEHLKTK